MSLCAAALCLSAAAVSAQDFDFRSYYTDHQDEIEARRSSMEFRSPDRFIAQAGPGPDLPCPVDSDVPERVQQQLSDDFAFIKTIRGSSASRLHREVFGEVDGENYYKFFTSRVKSIGLDECGGGNAVACVQPYYDPSKMWLTQNYIKFSHPQIARLMVVFHESRHTETNHGNWMHAKCPTPFADENGREYTSIWTGASLAGEPACDRTAFGSYGSSMIMLKNVQKFCSSCTDKVRMDAGIYADDQFNRVIDAQARSSIRKDLY